MVAEPAKIKVLNSLPEWLPQTQTWMFTQCKHTPPEFEHHVLCTRTNHLDQFPMSHIHCFEQELSRPRQWAEKAARRIYSRWGKITHLPYEVLRSKRLQPQILHSHFGNYAWRNIPLARGCGARQIVTFYGFDVSRLPRQELWRQRYETLFEKTHGVLCEGRAMGKALEKLGCPREKITIQHLGIELDRYPFRPRTLRRGESLRVLMVGRFTEKKGFPIALEALGKFARQHPLHITIIGDAQKTRSGADLREKEKMQETISRMGLESKVHFMGYQHHAVMIREAYGHHLSIAPSITASNGDSEGGAPVSLIEMAASGMPVVATRHCDIPEVLNYGRDHWLAREHHVDDLVDILERWVAAPKEWNARLVHARRHVEKEYDAVIQGQRLGEIYTRLLSNTPTQEAP